MDADTRLATRAHTQGHYAITTVKLPISKAKPIDEMTKRLGIPVPEMIFGDNLVSISHEPSGWSLRFLAEPALDRVDKTGANGILKVAHAADWSRSREGAALTEGIREVVRPYDWSYTTDYRGTERPGHACTQMAPSAEHVIPLPLLQRRDPILFFDEVTLYESELDDNGTSSLKVKLRVMEKRMLLLCRLFMRLDNVLVRVRDTRVYIDFETDLVVREYTAREDTPEKVMTITQAMRDGSEIVELLPVVEQKLESVSLAKAKAKA